MQLGRMHSSHIHCSLPFILYMFADGPPRSLIVPRKSGICFTDSTSRRMLSLVRGDGAEAASTEAPAMHVDRVLDHLVRGDWSAFAVLRMRQARVRQVET